MLLNLCTSASAKVYFPMTLKGSAIRNRATIQPARKPMPYMKPSNPLKAIIPATPRKEAALR